MRRAGLPGLSPAREPGERHHAAEPPRCSGVDVPPSLVVVKSPTVTSMLLVPGFALSSVIMSGDRVNPVHANAALAEW
jgi:hypothetical protein